MSFYKKDDKKSGAPVIPGSAFKKTSAFGKAPIFSRAAGGLMDRLKNLSSKDMVLVGIGLSVLVMAPVAEYMMSQPPTNPMLTASGFGDRTADGDALYEPGINGLSTGSSNGSGDVITPLASRDPASLILGASPAAPAPAPAVAAPPPSSSWRDSMADSARAAMSQAVKKAPPTNIPKMAVRGLVGSFYSGSGGGGSKQSALKSDIVAKAKKASSKAKSRSMVGPVAMADYKGVASNTPNSASRGAFEKLRSAADKSASNFTGGSATSALDKAAADSVQVGDGLPNAGGLGDGPKTGATSQSNKSGSHSHSGGYDPALEAAKARQQKALEWEFFKKYEIPKQFINAIVGEVSKQVASFIGNGVKSALNPSGPSGPTQWCIKVDASGKEYAAMPASMCLSQTGSASCGNVCHRVGTADSLNGGTGGANNNTTTGGGNGTTTGGGVQNAAPPHNGVGKPEVVQQQSKNFDEAVKALMQSVKDTEGKSGEKLLTNMKESLLPQIKALMTTGGESSVRGVMNGLATVEQKQAENLRTYRAGIVEANSRIDASAAAAKEFRTKVLAITGDSEGKGFDPKARETFLNRGQKGITAAYDPKNPLIKSLKDADADIANQEKFLASAKQELQFHDNAAGFFDTEDGKLPNARAKISELATAIWQEAQGIEESIAGISKDNLSSFVLDGETRSQNKANSQKLEEAYKKVWDEDNKENKNTLVVRILELRGYSIVDKELNDSELQEKEDTLWESVSPNVFYLNNDTSEKRGGYTAQDAGDLLHGRQNPAMITLIKRGKFELTYDLSQLKGKPETDVVSVANTTDGLLKKYNGILTGAGSTPGGTDQDGDDQGGDHQGGDHQGGDDQGGDDQGGDHQGGTDQHVSTGTAGGDHHVSTSPAGGTPVSTSTVTVDPAVAELKNLQNTGYAKIDEYTTIPGSKEFADWPKKVSKDDYPAEAKEWKALTTQIKDKRKELVQLRKDLAAATSPDAARDILAKIDTKTGEIDRLIPQVQTQVDEVNRKERLKQQEAANAEALKKDAFDSLPKGDLRHIRLLKEGKWIDAYGPDGSKLTVEYCDGKWETESTYMGLSSKKVCKRGAWSREQYNEIGRIPAVKSSRRNDGTMKSAVVQIKVPDFSLIYDDGNVRVKPMREKGFGLPTTPDTIEAYKRASLKEEQYDMEVNLDCQYSKKDKKWIINNATLRKGKAGSSDSLGGSFSAGWDLGVKLTGTVSYSHVWSHFRFGTTEEVPNMVGRDCTDRN